jgi:hypothetical protein
MKGSAHIKTKELKSDHFRSIIFTKRTSGTMLTIKHAMVKMPPTQISRMTLMKL